jgi:hypothetical protein
MDTDIGELSAKDLAEFKDIFDQEFGPGTPDTELKETAANLLRLFRVLCSGVSGASKPKLTGQELQAFKAIGQVRNGRSPSVRELCRALGWRSSRSGFKVIQSLTAKGYVYRAQNGELKVKGQD